MAQMNLVFPVLPGQKEAHQALLAQIDGAKRDEFNERCHRLGVKWERGFYQDTPAAAKSFATGHAADWPDVIDPSGALAAAYTVVAPPQTYFIDRTGVLRSRQIGQITQADLDRQLAAILP